MEICRRDNLILFFWINVTVWATLYIFILYCVLTNGEEKHREKLYVLEPTWKEFMHGTPIYHIGSFLDIQIPGNISG